MIIYNGTLQTVEVSGGGMSYGRPVPVTETLGAEIACNIRTIKSDHQGVIVDGVFTQSSFEVLVEVENFTAKRVVLTDNRGNRLGDFQVQDVQHLDYVGAVKITV
jgi:hypothetical protein